jgi:hypothetical protein
MAKIIYLSLLSLVLFICSDKRSASHSNILLSKGTVVLVFIDKDSILVAADSRSETISPNHISVFSDTTNKIVKVGNVFFTAAGTTVFKSRSVQAIIKKNYDPAKPIFENCENINRIVARELQNYFNQLSRQEKQYYTGEELSNTLITILATGYEKNKPVACSMTVGAAFANNRIGVTSGGIKKDSSLLRLHVGGYYELIYDYPYGYWPGSKNRLKDIMKLIVIEARYHPAQVDTLVHYAIIKRDGFRMGRNY